MPNPKKDETQEDFISRCIPIVLEEGTAKDNKQAAAVCHSTWREAKGERQRESFEAEIRLAEGEHQGTEWDVTIIGESDRSPVVTIGGRDFIKSLNGRLYAIDKLAESVTTWAGVKVYDNHLTDAEFKQKAGMRSVASEWIGTIVKPRWEAAKRQLRGIFKVVDEGLARKLKSAWDQGVLETIGLSIDTKPFWGQPVMHEGNRWPTIEGFKKILSVDLVAEQAAGGGFNRILAAEQTQQEATMDLEAILKALKEDEKLQAALVGALAADSSQEAKEEDAEEEAAPESEEKEQQQPADIVNEAVRALECRLILSEKLATAKLGDKHEALVRGIYEGKVFEEKALDSTIAHAKEAQAASDPSGHPKGVGQQRATESVFDEADMQEVEFMRKVMWSTEFQALESAEEDWVKERVPESYSSWIKAGRPNLAAPYRLSELVMQILGGNPFDPNQRTAEAATTSSMSSIVKNTVNIMLAANYATRQRWWEPIVRTEEVDTIDTATLVRVFGLSTLSVVAEGNPYTELVWSDEEETAAFVKRGNYVGVTLEALLSDKIQAIRTLPTRLAASWYNTISAMVDGVFTGNSDTGPVLTTTGALFNNTAIGSTGGHANLLTAALTFSSYAASRTAMMKQTDRPLGAGVKLGGLRPRYCVVGVDLDGQARQLFGTEKEPFTGNNEMNPYFKECEVIVNPVEDDANNWALVADPQQFPAIWLIFLRGLRAPAIFEAGDESGGAMFTNDTLRYKVRLMTWRFSSTYDCAPVSDFRPLHKNNVS